MKPSNLGGNGGMKSGIRFAIAILILLLSFSFPGMADEFHYNNLFIGERPSGLAGAYTALSDDPPGLFFNPAGIVGGENMSSTSLNAYALSETTYDNVLGDHEWARRHRELMPGYLGFTYALPKGMAGFSVAVTDSELVNHDQKLDTVTLDGIPWFTHSVIHYNFECREYNAGPSYAIGITDTVSIGTTIYLHYKEKEEILHQKFEYDDIFYEFESTDVNIEETEWGIKPIIGIMVKPKGGNFSFGASLSRTFLLKREYSYEFTRLTYEHDDDYPEDDVYELIDVEDDSARKREYPYTFSIGAAYAFTPSFLLSVNITYYTETERQDDNDTPGTFSTKSFVNGAVGAEYTFSEKWILRAGVYTDYANTDMDGLAFDERRESIDMYGATASLTRKQEEKMFTLGTAFGYGEGEAALGDIGFGDQRSGTETVDARKYTCRVFLSLSM